MMQDACNALIAQDTIDALRERCGKMTTSSSKSAEAGTPTSCLVVVIEIASESNSFISHPCSSLFIVLFSDISLPIPIFKNHTTRMKFGLQFNEPHTEQLSNGKKNIRGSLFSDRRSSSS